MAVPVIAAYIAKELAIGGIKNYIAVRRAAREYYEFQYLSELELRQLSALLAQNTNTLEWEWFQTLRDMKRFGLLAPTLPEQIPDNGGNGNQQDQTGQPAWTWWLLAGIGVLAVFILQKD